MIIIIVLYNGAVLGRTGVTLHLFYLLHSCMTGGDLVISDKEAPPTYFSKFKSVSQSEESKGGGAKLFVPGRGAPRPPEQQQSQAAIRISPRGESAPGIIRSVRRSRFYGQPS